MKNNLKFVGFFALKSIFFALITFFFYAVSLHYFGGGTLLYYKGIVIILTIFGLLTITLFCIQNDFPANFPALCLATILAYSFHTTVPVILDRSISIQIIGSLSNQQMQIKDLNNAFLKGYVDNYSTTCRRINEQLATGNVIIENGTAKLTNKGLRMQKIFNKIAEFLNIEDHYIKGNQGTNYRHHYDLENNHCLSHY